jgi:hypothetical protein
MLFVNFEDIVLILIYKLDHFVRVGKTCAIMKQCNLQNKWVNLLQNPFIVSVQALKVTW